MKKLLLFLLISFLINENSKAQTSSVTSTNCTAFGCNDGTITASSASTVCNGYTATIYVNGNMGQSVLLDNTNYPSYTFGNLAPGNYMIIIELSYYNNPSNLPCPGVGSNQTIDTFNIAITQPSCDISANILNSVTTTTGVNCATGSIQFESSSSSCLSSTHTATVYRDGNQYSQFGYGYASNPQTLSNLPAGSYYINVDNGTCNLNSSVVEIEDTSCNISINLNSVNNASGNNCNNGSISFTPQTNTCNPTTYVATLKKNGQVHTVLLNVYSWYYWWGYQQTFSNLGPGNYELSMFDGECEKILPISITEPPCNLNIKIDTFNNLTGLGCGNGSILYNVTDSFTCASSYSWQLFRDGNLYDQSGCYWWGCNYGSLNAGQQTRGGLPRGTYYYIVNNNYCTDTSSTITIVEPSLEIVIDSFANSNSSGCNTGKIFYTVTSTNNCAPYYNWYLYKNNVLLTNSSCYWWGCNYGTINNVQQQFQGLSPGDYYIIVETNGLFDTSSIVTITEPICNLIVSIDSSFNTTGVSCNNGQLYYHVSDSTTCNTTYNWALYKDGNLYEQSGCYWWGCNYGYVNGGELSRTSLPPGVYYYVINNGICIDTSNYVTITEPICTLTMIIDSVHHSTGTACNNGQIYYTVTDNSTCYPTYSWQLFKDGNLYEQSYAYWWGNNYGTTNNGQIVRSNLPPGNYFYVINNGVCIDTSANVQIDEPICNLEIVLDSVHANTGTGCNNGSFYYSVNGNTCATAYNWQLIKDGAIIDQSYNYWYGNNLGIVNAGNLVRNNLAPGTYYYVVNNGVCVDTSEMILIGVPSCDLHITVDSFHNSTGASCNNGQFFYSVTDNNTCATSYSWQLIKDGNIIDQSYAYWYGNNYGVVNAGQLSRLNLAPGTYNYVVNNGVCIDTSDSIIITEPICESNITVDNVVHLVCSNSNTGSILYTPINSSCYPNYIAYLIKDGVPYSSTWWQGFGSQTGFYNLPAGNYQIDIWNNYCHDTSEIITINSPAYLPLITIDSTVNSNSHLCNDGVIYYTPIDTNACSDYFYLQLLKNGVLITTNAFYASQQNQVTWPGLSAGNYQIITTSGTRIDTSSIITITEPPHLPTQLILGAITNSSGYLCNNGSIVFTPTQFDACTAYYKWELFKEGNLYTYNYWLQYGIQATIGNLPPGNYELKIWNVNNQIDTSITFIITEPSIQPPAQITIDAINNSSGYLCNNGSILFTPIQTNDCRTTYYATLYKNGNWYAWNASCWWGCWYPSYGNQSGFSNLGPGNYMIEIHNGSYMDTTFSFSITEPTTCNVNAVIDNVTFSGGCNSGIIYYTINSTSCPSNYDIKLYKNGILFTNTNVTSNNQYQFANLSAGTYYLVANNGNCLDTSNSVVVNNQITISSSISNPICHVSIPVFSVTPANPITNPSYRWKINGVTQQTSSSTTFTPTSIANNDVVTCQLLGTGCNISSNSLTMQVVICTDVNLNLKAFIQGYYQINNNMKPVLANQGIGTSTVDVDTMTVELHEATSPNVMAYSEKAVLKTNGQLICQFPPQANGHSYYIVLKHRNSIETWSANPVTMSVSVNYDFTTTSSSAYGNNLALTFGAWTLYTGDIDQDGITEVSDYSLWETDANNFESGYLSTDLNGDGSVDISDYSFWETNANDFVGLIKP